AGPDSRRRSHRASGGAWFSASECPVSFEKLTDRQSLVRPEDYKSSGDPEPFTIEYTELASPNGIAAPVIRLAGASTSADTADHFAMEHQILAYLAENPGSSGRAIASGCHARKDAVLAALDRLFKSNQLDCLQKGRAHFWTVRPTQ